MIDYCYRVKKKVLKSSTATSFYFHSTVLLVKYNWAFVKVYYAYGLQSRRYTASFTNTSVSHWVHGLYNWVSCNIANSRRYFAVAWILNIFQLETALFINLLLFKKLILIHILFFWSKIYLSKNKFASS